jgi:hypothetical protein
MRNGPYQECLIDSIFFTIGGTTIAIDNAVSEPDILIPAAYKPFITSCEPDIRITVKLGQPNLSGCNKVFDSPPIWSLHQCGRKRVFSIFSRIRPRSYYFSLFQEQPNAEIHFPRAFTRPLDPFCGPALELLTVERLADSSGCLLHGCGIQTSGRGLLFAGPSGVGKSTMLQLWSDRQDTLILSDDRTIARQTGGRISIYGTPWHGKVRRGMPDRANLAAIFFLKHGTSNKLHELDTGSAVRRLLTSSFPPLWDGRGMTAALEFFDIVARGIPSYELEFVPDASVVEYLRRRLD